MAPDVEALCRPVSAEAPCGADLEDTQLLAGFDAYRLFGSDIPLGANIDWREVRDKSLQALDASHDLRLLAHLAAAIVRIEGLIPLCILLTVADRWLSESWELVFPRITEDAILRRNALNSFADRMAVVDAVRRAAVLTHRQLGSFCLRDVELATGQLTAGPADASAPNMAQIRGIFAGSTAADLTALTGAVQSGVGALSNIVATMQTRAGFEAAPDFDPLLRPLSQINKLLQEHVPATAPGAMTGTIPEKGGTSAVSGGIATDVNSREDAIRTLETIATWFRTHEPSSPVPLLLDRARRLVSRSFMEVLADIAPDSVAQARLIGGIRNDEGQ
jgi:type VI secretion system protein ImpA